MKEGCYKINSNFKKGLVSFLVLIFLVVAFSGCAMQRTNPLPGQPNVQQKAQDMQKQGFQDGNPLNMTTKTGEKGNALNVTPQTGQDGIMGNNPQTNQPGVIGQMNADTQKAENIKTQVKSMKEVKDASVIVIGNTALVGCDLASYKGNTENIRNSVIQKVKSTDKSITNCVVSESPEILGKVNTLGKDIANGKPANEITDEFNRIIKSITKTTTSKTTS